MEVLDGFQVFEHYAAERMALVAFTGQGHHTDVCVGKSGCDEHGWEKELDEEGVSEVVCAELDLVAVFCEAGWESHYAGVAD